MDDDREIKQLRGLYDGACITELKAMLTPGLLARKTDVMAFMGLVFSATTRLQSFPFANDEQMAQDACLGHVAAADRGDISRSQLFATACRHNLPRMPVRSALVLYTHNHFVTVHCDEAGVSPLFDTRQGLWANDDRRTWWRPRLSRQIACLYGTRGLDEDVLFDPHHLKVVQQPGGDLSNLCGPLACAMFADIMLADPHQHGPVRRAQDACVVGPLSAERGGAAGPAPGGLTIDT